MQKVLDGYLVCRKFTVIRFRVSHLKPCGPKSLLLTSLDMSSDQRVYQQHSLIFLCQSDRHWQLDAA